MRARGGCLSAVGWFVLTACGSGCGTLPRSEEGGWWWVKRRRAVFFGCLTFLGLRHLPPCSVELSPLSCGAVLERGCVLSCVRVSSAMRFLGVAFVVDIGYKLSFQMYHVCEVCVWSKHAPKSVQFFWNRCRSSTLMSKAVIKLCVYAGTLERCRFFFFFFGFFG